MTVSIRKGLPNGKVTAQASAKAANLASPDHCQTMPMTVTSANPVEEQESQEVCLIIIASGEEKLIVQQVDLLESGGPACNDHFSMTLEYTVDHGESEGTVVLQLGEKFKAFEKDLLDAIAPVLCERVRNIRGKSSNHSVARPCLPNDRSSSRG